MHEVVVGATVWKVVGEESTTDAFPCTRINDMIADVQRLQNHSRI